MEQYLMAFSFALGVFIIMIVALYFSKYKKGADNPSCNGCSCHQKDKSRTKRMN
jgi:hypothetical protein